MARRKELRKKEAANKLISEINSEEVIDGLLPSSLFKTQGGVQMSLSKEITLIIKDYSIKLSNPLKFYVNDSLKLVFTIKKMGIINANNFNTISADYFPLDGLTAKLLIENLQGIDSIEATTIEGNKISFIFTNKYTRYPGTGKMQIRLTDKDGCELKLPEFRYRVKRSINENLDNTIPETIMRALTTEDNKLLLSEDGKILIY